MPPPEKLPITLHSALPDGQLWVHWMKGHEELGRLYEYELELFAESADLPFGDLIGQPMTVCVPRQDGLRFFNGLLTRLSRVGYNDRFVVLRGTLAPRLWLLTRTRDCRVYQEVTVPEVVRAVLREHDIPFSERLQTGSYRKWDYLTQYRESDHAFLSRIMEQEGIYYYFKHSLEKNELVLADSVSSHDPVPGYESLPFRPPGMAKVKLDHLTGWRPANRAATARVTLQDHDFRLRRGSDIKVVRAAESQHPEDEFEIYDYPGNYVVGNNKEEPDARATREAGEHYALARLDELRSKMERVEATGNARGVEVGALFRTDAPEEAGKEFLVVSTAYEFRNAQLVSGGEGGEEVCKLSFTGIDSKRQFHPERTTPKPVVPGPQTARVVGKADHEIWTDKYGRVKVQFHWDREGSENEASSCWVRVGQIWAGKNWGALFLPRMGQEVIVQFLEGDPDRPLVTGSLYNVDNMPPYTLPENATQSGIKTRSSKGGTDKNFNEIRFEDKKGEEQLHIQAEKNMTTEVEHDQSLSVGGDRSVSVSGNESITVDHDRTVHVKGNQTITIDGGGKSPIHSSVTVTGKHRLDASDCVDVQAPNYLKLTCGGSSILIEDNKITLAAGGEAILVLDANVFAQAKGKAQVLLDANVLAQSKGDTQLLLDGDARLSSKGDAHVNAATVQLQGTEKVVASAGSGGLELAGPGATMSGTKTTVSGTGMTEITGLVVKIN